MANHLDLEEQEKLDQIKHFWSRFGTPISIALLVIVSLFAARNGYLWWEARQAERAAAMHEEVDRIISAGDVAASDKAYSDMRTRFPSTFYTQDAGLRLAKLAYVSGKLDLAEATLLSVSQIGADEGLAALAKLRRAGVLLEMKKFESSLQALSGDFPAEFAGLVADKKADVYSAQGVKQSAIDHYQKALQLLSDRDTYRRIVEIKLSAMGGVISQ